MQISFMDYGLKDFIRDESGNVLIKDFDNYDDAEDFIMNGGLEEFGWTNQGTRKWCWDEDANED